MSSSYRITLEEVLASLPGEISPQMWKKMLLSTRKGESNNVRLQNSHIPCKFSKWYQKNFRDSFPIKALTLTTVSTRL